MAVQLIARPTALAAFVCGRCAATDVPHHARGLCQSCYQYLWRTGQARPAWLCTASPRSCVVCGGPSPAGSGKRCPPCRRYWSAIGHERPPRLWGRSARRRGA